MLNRQSYAAAMCVLNVMVVSMPSSKSCLNTGSSVTPWGGAVQDLGQMAGWHVMVELFNPIAVVN